MGERCQLPALACSRRRLHQLSVCSMARVCVTDCHVAGATRTPWRGQSGPDEPVLVSVMQLSSVLRVTVSAGRHDTAPVSWPWPTAIHNPIFTTVPITVASHPHSGQIICLCTFTRGFLVTYGGDSDCESLLSQVNLTIFTIGSDFFFVLKGSAF